MRNVEVGELYNERRKSAQPANMPQGRHIRMVLIMFGKKNQNTAGYITHKTQQHPMRLRDDNKHTSRSRPRFQSQDPVLGPGDVGETVGSPSHPAYVHNPELWVAPHHSVALNRNLTGKIFNPSEWDMFGLRNLSSTHHHPRDSPRVRGRLSPGYI